MEILNADDLKDLNGGDLAYLVRDLIIASVPYSKLDEFYLPVVNLTGAHGFDGIVDVDYEDRGPCIPNGKSRWEFGVTKGPENKANSDYNKRMEEASPDVTFVFVTNRIFDKRDTWANEKREQKKWKDVCVVEANILIEWIHAYPSVEVKWSSKLKKISTENDINGKVYTLEDYFEEWKKACGNRLSRKFVKGLGQNSRSTEVNLDKKIEIRLGSKKSNEEIIVEASSVEESRVYIASVVLSLDGKNKDIFKSKSICINTESLLRDFSDVLHGALVVTPVDNRGIIQKLLDNECKVVLLSQRSSRMNEKIFKLPVRFERGIFEQKLRNIGFSSTRIKKWEDGSGRNLLALRTFLGEEFSQLKGESLSRSLVVALMVGGWCSTKEDDRYLLKELSKSESYASFEEEIAPLTTGNGAIIQNVGDYWKVISPYLAVRYIFNSGRNTKSVFEDFKRMAIQLLSKEDKVAELPSEKRAYASIYNIENGYSNLLRKSVCDSLIVIADILQGNDIIGANSQYKRGFIDSIVGDVIQNSSWASLASIVQEVAEASPDVFIRAFLKDVVAGKEDVFNLLNPNTGVFEESHHINYLWALEVLAWNEEYLEKTTEILIRLAVMWRGIKTNWGNMPISQLAEIYNPIFSKTNASFENQQKILGKLVQRESDVVDVLWDVLVYSLPKGSSISIEGAAPKWRWEAVTPPKHVEKDHYWKVLDYFCEVLLRISENDADKMVGLLKRSNRGLRESWFESLGKLFLSVDCFDELQKYTCWSGLRLFLAKNRQFKDANWAIPEEALGLYQRAFEDLEPQGDVKSGGWLFVGNPEVCCLKGVSYPEEFEKHEEIQEACRQDFLERVYKKNGRQGLIDFIQGLWGDEEILDGQSPYIVGRSVGSFMEEKHGDTSVLDMISLIDWGNVPQHVMSGLFSSIYNEKNFESDVYRRLKEIGEKVALYYLLWANLDCSVLNALKSLNESVKKEFWERCFVYRLDDDEIIDSVISRLIEVKRNYEAIHLINTHFEVINHNNLLEQFDSLINDDILNNSNSLYEIACILEKMETEETIESAQLARIEFTLFELFESYDKEPTSLIKCITGSPETFFELLQMAFKSRKKEVEDERERVDEKVASKAYSILNFDRRGEGWLGAKAQTPDALKVWILEVQNKARELGYSEISDQIIGTQLALVPAKDGVWPPKEVSEVLEAVSTENLRIGFCLGWANQNSSWSGSGVDHFSTLKHKIEEYLSQLPEDKYETIKCLEDIKADLEHDIECSKELEELRREVE
ncbi:hypothetical protein LWC08_09135 [Desulfobaculum bizertense]|uniref:hypothetical protein n=1 Tax=Desulfobaculum bizertense TaxID=376490 RepID=UPI001F23A3DC|nr:hypothetical protein [Desulfobaculum bizertense]UIJ36903.1 hypothetical protein LWC08_09135 [Desulfobaculum bizertense]